MSLAGEELSVWCALAFPDLSSLYIRHIFEGLMGLWDASVTAAFGGHTRVLAW